MLSKLKNFTKTANQLGYAQSSVTFQIKQLETEFGVKLFERLGKSTVLTNEGKAMVPYVEEIVRISTQMQQVITNNTNTVKIIRIGTAESLCSSFLFKVIQEFQRLEPDVQVKLKLLDCKDYVPMIQSNEVDLVFTLGNEIKEKEITAEEYIKVPVQLFCSKKCKLYQRSIIHAADLDHHPLVLTEQGCQYRGLLENEFNLHGIHMEPVLETGSIQVIKEAVDNGLGIGFLPRLAIEKELKKGIFVPISYEKTFETSVMVIHHKDKWISPVIQKFLELTHQTITVIQEGCESIEQSI